MSLRPCTIAYRSALAEPEQGHTVPSKQGLRKALRLDAGRRFELLPLTAVMLGLCVLLHTSIQLFAQKSHVSLEQTHPVFVASTAGLAQAAAL